MNDVNDVAAAVLGELGPMETMKLQKLVYYSQAWHLAIKGQPLFSDPIEAWADGPVVNTIYQQHKGWRTVSAWPSGDPDRVAPEGQTIVQLVCRKYGHLSGDELSTLTHHEQPWVAARGTLTERAYSRTHLSEDLMASFYRDHELGGRRAADLAVGGIHPMPSAPPAPGYKEALADLRAEYAGQPENDPAPGDTYGRGDNPPLTEAELARLQRTRSRVRPERRRARA